MRAVGGRALQRLDSNLDQNTAVRAKGRGEDRDPS